MCSEKMIFSIQLVAAFLMASDYLFDDNQRAKINGGVIDYAQNQLDRISKDIDASVDFTSAQLAYFLHTLLIVFVSLITIGVTNFLSALVSPVAGLMLVTISLVMLCVFALGLTRLTPLIVRLLFPRVLGWPFTFFAWFVIRCPKGAVFGIGFIFLMGSFFCRFLNLP